MVKETLFIGLSILMLGCAPKSAYIHPALPETALEATDFASLEGWESEKTDSLLGIFRENCQAEMTRKLYGALCDVAQKTEDSRRFFETGFLPYRVNGHAEGLLTGYYEPMLEGSLTRSERFRYPVYGVPKELVTVRLDGLYDELKGMRLRGKMDGNELVPYYSRSQMDTSGAPVICWVDDKVSLYFLEVQGSGRIRLSNGETLYVGYANQNGHPYRSIGKYLVEIGEIPEEEISLQSIRQWAGKHPERVDELFNINPSQVFFEKRAYPATGSLGVELVARHSVAVDTKYVPLGSMLFIQSNQPFSGKPMAKAVFAMDTGGAIKGEVRADYFWGFGEDAERKAGVMKAPLKMWILLPNESGLR